MKKSYYEEAGAFTSTQEMYLPIIEYAYTKNAYIMRLVIVCYLVLKSIVEFTLAMKQQ